MTTASLDCGQVQSLSLCLLSALDIIVPLINGDGGMSATDRMGGHITGRQSGSLRITLHHM